MEKLLQQRLVGTIVLVALGVILIPALLDGSGYKSRNVRTIEIPPKPSFPPASQVKVKPIVTPLDQRKKVVEKKKQTTPVQPIKAWALQVGTFDAKANANALRDKLRKAGHTAYVEKSGTSGKTSYRVRIGPELEKARVEKLKLRLKKEQKIDGFIVNHP
jgi:DedD protein